MTNEKKITQIPPENAEQPYMHTVLYIILITTVFLTGTITLLQLLLDIKQFEISIAISFALSVIMLWFTFRGKLWVPRMLVPTYVYAVATFTSVTHNGIRDISMVVYPIAILLAGMFTGGKGVILYTSIVAITVAVIGYLDITHQLASPFSQFNTIENVVTVNIVLIVIGVVLYVTIDNLNKNLRRAQRSETESAQRYNDLQSISESLEKQILERTHSAEAAQQTAETAKRTLEMRMWQFEGTARLSEMMRGEQDVPTLAQNVIRGLCEYLEVPLGALFILEENVLNFTGGYAYPLDDVNDPVHFAVGEGIVGQAALEQRTIKISDVPVDYVAVSSGLGEAVPRHILVVPFVEENHVVGVIEIGSFTELYPEHIQFIESSLKNIAIAFNTAQARARINELLRETQELAEELQAQEEELRAANEELEVQTERLRESYNRMEQHADGEEA